MPEHSMEREPTAQERRKREEETEARMVDLLLGFTLIVFPCVVMVACSVAFVGWLVGAW